LAEHYCNAVHNGTGAVCELLPDHIENHRGPFAHGITQWPVDDHTTRAIAEQLYETICVRLNESDFSSFDSTFGQRMSVDAIAAALTAAEARGRAQAEQAGYQKGLEEAAKECDRLHGHTGRFYDMSEVAAMLRASAAEGGTT